MGDLSPTSSAPAPHVGNCLLILGPRDATVGAGHLVTNTAILCPGDAT